MIAGLDQKNVTLILTTLLTEQFLQNFSLPDVLIQTFENLRGDRYGQLAKFSQEVGINVDTLKAFFNQSVNCAYTVRNNIPEASMITGLIYVDKLRVDCFGLGPWIPPSIFCSDEDVSGAIFTFMFLTGLFFVVITSFTRQRRNLWLSCCHGKPGPVIPLNMLDSYENRCGFALAFGLTAFQCLNVLLSRYESIYGRMAAYHLAQLPSFTSILVKICTALLIAVTSYPFFVCQHMKNKVTGSILGIIFSMAWLLMEIARLVYGSQTCWKLWKAIGYGEIFAVIKTMFDYPFYICLVLLLCKFIYTLVKTIIHRRDRRMKGEHLKHWMFEDDTDWKKEYMYLHVRNLLRHVKKLDGDEEYCKEEMKNKKDLKRKVGDAGRKIKTKMKSTLYEYIPNFKYSARMLASVFVTYIAMYHVTIFLTMNAYILVLAVNTIILDSVYASVVASFFHIKLDLLKEYVETVTVSLWLGIATGLVFSVLVMSNSVSWYRKHILMLRKGDYTFLPRPLRKKKFDSAALMVSSMKFAGFQVGYAVWGFLILVVILSVVYFVFITQIVFAIKYHKLTLLLQILLDVWPTLLIAVAVYILQYVSAIKLFLFDKQTLQVDNRRVYHILSYMMFYFNIFLGLVSCLLRIIYSVVTGVIFLQRLQKSTLPRAFEMRDPGYLSYMGYILLEHQHSNPVIQCFTRLLMESVHKQMSQEIHYKKTSDFSTAKLGLMPCGFMDDTDIKDVKGELRRKKRIVTRWHLFTILSLNPTLLKYRFKYSRKKYSLDLFSKLNPSLYWNRTNKAPANARNERSASIQEIPTNETLELLSKSLRNRENGSVRYRKLGNALEITYIIDKGDEAVAVNELERHLHDNNGDNIDDDFVQDIHDIPNDSKHGEIELDVMTSSESTSSIELLKYRKLSEMNQSSAHATETEKEMTAQSSTVTEEISNGSILNDKQTSPKTIKKTNTDTIIDVVAAGSMSHGSELSSTSVGTEFKETNEREDVGCMNDAFQHDDVEVDQ